MGAALGSAKASLAGTAPQQAEMGIRGRQMLRQVAPARKLMLKQLTEALRTGGVGAKIPMIQQAVSRANQATASMTAQTAEQLASKNIGGPFAARTIAGMRLAGAQQSAAIPTQMAEQLIGQFTPVMMGTQQLGMGAFSQSAQAAQQLAEFNAAQRQQQILQGGVLGGGRIAGIL